MHRKNLKGWNEVKTNDSWSVFKIMGEFVDGFENLSKIGPCVSIFGSARTKSDHPHYKLTCLLYTSPSPRDGLLSRMPSSA